ncbi:superoxide dismutase family protein [Lentibacillus juripiscarius]|uniref:Superoxide dismutase [Cu-Zn] n=1 Tax=Lentibacillus juripiscarius TaxID=257446 RepID=A0ABW5VCW1_9BACI
MKKGMLCFGLAFTVVLGACGDTDDTEETKKQDDETNVETAGSLSEDTETMEVDMYNADKEKVGTATIRPVPAGVNITLDAANLPPGTHGFHIHENAVCEAPDFKSAGGHFNPTDAKHGFDHPEGPHAGDLPNIEVNQDGKVMADVTADMAALEKGEKNSLLKEGGTALMIHSGADDYESQSSGDAGERIACGVIGE